MRIYRYRMHGGNFGDDLNAWLWPRVFPEYGWSDTAPDAFVGIGTVLTERLNDEPGRKLVFGAGMWLPSRLPKLDETLELRFVRGPISACYLPPGTRFITDAAAALHHLRLPQVDRTNAVGFMPHSHTAHAIDCQQLSESIGATFIDPMWPVEDVLDAIRSCDRVIAEAMHGAIVADVFRIPWCRISILCAHIDGSTAHSLKWLDWGMSLKADVSSEEGYRLPLPRGRLARPLYWAERYVRRERLAKGLAQLMNTGDFRLSSDTVHDEVQKALGEELERLRADLAAREAGD